MFKILYAVERNRMPEDFVDDLVFSEGEYEMMLFETAVYIEVEGKVQPYPPHTSIIFKPGQKVHYFSQKGEMVYTWIRFDCDEPLFAEGYVPFGIPIFCENYDYFLIYWRMVACENYWRSPSEKYIITELMHIIFHWLHDYAYSAERGRYQKELEALRHEIYEHPEYDWSLERMAKRVNLSVRVLQNQYKKFAHISCIKEVIESRIIRAKMLLAETDNNIGEVSEQCGYHNIEHFCRQFKKYTGSSPYNYRKMHRVHFQSC